MTRTTLMWLVTAIISTTVVSSKAEVVEKKTRTLDGAKRVAAAAVAYAKKNNAPGSVIAVVDDGGNLMYLERLDGTFAAGAHVSMGKARTAALFKKPTKVFEDVIKNGRTAMVAVDDFTPLQGGVPIEIDGAVVGAIGMSGAANAQQDARWHTRTADSVPLCPECYQSLSRRPHCRRARSGGRSFEACCSPQDLNGRCDQL